jgi:hypothetical protein
LKHLELNTDLLQERSGRWAHSVLFQVNASTEAEQGISSILKFISLCVATEVVVIVQYQDSRVGTCLLSIKVRSRKPADSSADNNPNDPS